MDCFPALFTQILLFLLLLFFQGYKHIHALVKSVYYACHGFWLADWLVWLLLGTDSNSFALVHPFICSFIRLLACFHPFKITDPTDQKTFSIFEHMKIMWKWTIWHRSLALTLSLFGSFIFHACTLDVDMCMLMRFQCRHRCWCWYRCCFCYVFNALMYIII